MSFQLPVSRRWNGNPSCSSLFFFAVVSVALYLGCSVGWANPLDTWLRRSAAPTGATLVGVTYGNGIYVAAGYNAVVISPDATNWNWIQYDYTNYGRLSYGIGFGAGTFVIVGAGGWTATSPDGTNWTTRSLGGGSMFDVAYGQGRYVAVGDVFKNSTDGINWTNSPSPERLLGIVYGNNEFITVGFYGIWGSSDGLNWSQRFSLPYLILEDVVYGGGRYVAVGYDMGQVGSPPVAYYSSDGFNWYSAGTLEGHSGAAVTHGQSKFLASGTDGTLMTSTLGTSWSITAAPLAMTVAGLHYANSKFVAAGGGGQVAVSENGTDWQQFSFPAAPTLQSVACRSNQSVAVGDGGSAVGSDDGTGWYPLSTGVTNSLLAVATTSNLFVAVGATGKIITSGDRTNWVNQFSPASQSLSDVNFATGQFTAVGDGGTLLTSTDGSNWVARVSNTTQPLKGVACGAGVWVAVGYSGTVVRSSNGVSWVASTVSTLKDLESVTFGNGRFIAVGGSGRGPGVIGFSTNGADWTLVGQNIGSSLTSFSHVTYAQGQFVAIGGAKVFSSIDGVNWQQRSAEVQSSLMGVSFGANRFVAVGAAGQIYQSAPVGPRLSIRPSPGGRLLTIFGHLGANYLIQGSTDLQTWQTIVSGSQSTDDQFEWEDSAVIPSRFYRVVFQ